MKLMATFLITCNVLIGNYSFARVNQIKVKSSWKQLSDVALIKLPLLRGQLNKARTLESLADKINQGDAVSITMGYQGISQNYSNLEFTGFVKRVNPNIPLEIECEDATWLLRRVNLNMTWRAVTLKTVLQYIVDQANAASLATQQISISGNIPVVNFDKFRLNNVNGAEALQQLKDKYGFVAYFRNFQLFVGLAFTDLVGNVRYSLQGNVIESDLTYRFAEETAIRLKAISILKDNTTHSIYVGSTLGELQTKYYYGISDPVTLAALAKQEISKLRFNGYEGSIQTYAIPFVQHSMSANLLDPAYQERQGNYMVDEVETEFGPGIGIKRKVTLGIKLT